MRIPKDKTRLSCPDAAGAIPLAEFRGATLTKLRNLFYERIEDTHPTFPLAPDFAASLHASWRGFKVSIETTGAAQQFPLAIYSTR